jgi:hypothetical protein
VQVLVAERWAAFRCLGGVGGHSAFYGVGAESSPGPCREQRIAGSAASFSHPDPYDLLSGAGERDGPLPAALAFASNVAACAEDDVGAVEAD